MHLKTVLQFILLSTELSKDLTRPELLHNLHINLQHPQWCLIVRRPDQSTRSDPSVMRWTQNKNCLILGWVDVNVASRLHWA